jgi:hypothetical protein
MSERMDTVLIEEVVAPLMGDMVVGDPQVLIVEAGVALIMVVDQIQLPDQNQEEVPSMNELKAQLMGDMIGMIQVIFFWQCYIYHIIFFDTFTVHAADLPHLVDQVQLPDQNQEEAPSMNELKAQ